MLPFFSLTGIFLSAILIYFNARKNPSVIYLGFFFLLISLHSLIMYVILYSKSTVLVSVFFLNIGFLTYMIGPMLYWYVRSVLTDNSHLRKSDCWHFLPMILFFVATLPHLFTPWSLKMELATKIVENANNVWIFNRIFFQNFLPAYIVFLSRPILILCYTVASFVLYIRYLKQPDKLQVLSKQTFMTKWLAVLFISLFILIFSYVGLIAEVKKNENIFIFYTINLLLGTSGIGLAGLLISPFFFPEVLYGIPQIPAQSSSDISIIKVQRPAVSKPNFSFTSKGKKSKSLHHENKKQLLSYERNYLLMIEQKAENCMMERQLYLKPDCNLASLAKQIHNPGHHLSYYFREVRKQSFNDFRNECRVNHAKKLMLKGMSSEMSMEGIGLLSGFSSRNAFYNAFKKAEGISPGVFAAQHVE